jgi:hypothetical protein
MAITRCTEVNKVQHWLVNETSEITGWLVNQTSEIKRGIVATAWNIFREELELRNIFREELELPGTYSEKLCEMLRSTAS